MREIDTSNMPDQGTLAWHRARLGHFTGSGIAKLMTNGKSNAAFSETAKSYIIKVMAERCLAEKVVNDNSLFDYYITQTTVISKAMQWGSDNEQDARKLYEGTRGCKVVECGSIEHPTIPMYAASPDGLVDGADRVIEIKCPNPDTALTYRSYIKDAQTLKKVKPEYYWQIQAELDCTDAQSADFIVYCPWFSVPIYTVRIERVDEDITNIHFRIARAERWAAENLDLSI